MFAADEMAAGFVELLAVLGVERYGLRVKELAEHLGKHPVTVTGWVMRGVSGRVEDAETAARLDALDRKVGGGKPEKARCMYPAPFLKIHANILS